jgi:hypothetical protein
VAGGPATLDVKLVADATGDAFGGGGVALYGGGGLIAQVGKTTPGSLVNGCQFAEQPCPPQVEASFTLEPGDYVLRAANGVFVHEGESTSTAFFELELVFGGGAAGSRGSGPWARACSALRRRS